MPNDLMDDDENFRRHLERELRRLDRNWPFRPVVERCTDHYCGCPSDNLG
jgi:hypothetical protein